MSHTQTHNTQIMCLFANEKHQLIHLNKYDTSHRILLPLIKNAKKNNNGNNDNIDKVTKFMLKLKRKRYKKKCVVSTVNSFRIKMSENENGKPERLK